MRGTLRRSYGREDSARGFGTDIRNRSIPFCRKRIRGRIGTTRQRDHHVRDRTGKPPRKSFTKGPPHQWRALSHARTPSGPYRKEDHDRSTHHPAQPRGAARRHPAPARLRARPRDRRHGAAGQQARPHPADRPAHTPNAPPRSRAPSPVTPSGTRRRPSCSSATSRPAGESLPVIEAASERLRSSGVTVRDRLVVHDRRWRSLDCDRPTCCPPEGSPLPAPAEVASTLAEFVGIGSAPLPNRTALAGQLEPGPAAAEVADPAGAGAVAREPR